MVRRRPRQRADDTVEIDGVTVQVSHHTLTVPERRADPTSRTIIVPIRRLAATGTAVEPPVYHLAGGPGMSNLAFRPPLRLLERHDVVLVGYRGVDGAVVLDAPEVDRAIRGVGGDLFSERSRNRFADAVAAAAARLQQTGIDLDGYTIPEVMQDIEDARRQFDDPSICLLSESYGTRVAQHYAEHHPDRVTRSVMIGVNPPGHFSWDVETIDEQLDLLGSLYAASVDEQAGEGCVDLVETVRRVSADMPRRWMMLPINPGKVRAAAFAMLFNRRTGALALDAYLAAGRGDHSGLAVLSLVYDLVFPKLAVWGDFFSKGFSADVGSAAGETDWRSPGGVMGSPISELIWPAAERWPTRPIGDDYRAPRPTQIETLLVGGNIDFSTPPVHATRELLPVLERGHQLVLTDLGHTTDFWYRQPEAAARLVTDFFADGSVGHDLFAHEPLTFDPGFFSLPRVAKLGSAIAVALSAIAVVNAVNLFRLVRNR